MRSREKSVFKLDGHNTFLWGTMAASFILTAAVIFVPFLRTIFSFESIAVWEYILALVIGALILPISELVKYLKAKNK
jgi:Ca2+-transporting ATPase